MERRTLERGAARHLAYAVVDDRALLTWIVDATRAGLRLVGTLDQALPSHFVLVVPSINRTLVCDARWASGATCGVSIREERSDVPSNPLVRWVLAREDGGDRRITPECYARIDGRLDGRWPPQEHAATGAAQCMAS